MPKEINIEIYIDQDFIRNFWKLDLTNDVIADFRKSILLQSRNFKLLTNFSSIDEIKRNEEDLLFFEMIWEGTREMEFLQESNREEWINHPDKGVGYKLYFLELPDHKCKELSRKCGYEVLNSSLLQQEWSKYIDKNILKTLDIPPVQGDSEVFNSWLDLAFIGESPSNSVIILDKYILADNSKQKISDNLLPLLDSIVSINKSEKIDILIITEQISSKLRNVELRQRAQNTYETLTKFFSRHDSCDISITILIHNKTFQPVSNPDFHDRIIYTTNYTINCGVGFNLFDGNKRYVCNSQIEVHFNFQRYYMRQLPRHLLSLVNYINKVKRTEVLNQFKYYPEIKCSLVGF